MVLQMVSPDKKKKNREKRKKKSKKGRAELEKTKEGRAILNKTKLYMSLQKEKKVASDKKNAAKKKSRSRGKHAKAENRLKQRKKKAELKKNIKIEFAEKFDNYQKTNPPFGVFDGEGGLVSGKSPSLANQQKFSTIPKSGRIKLTSNRVPRKCSGIHPHCSICGKCHRNVRTHWIGH
jgi:hypothetical protein